VINGNLGPIKQTTTRYVSTVG